MDSEWLAGLVLGKPDVLDEDLAHKSRLDRRISSALARAR
jgi:hypothetical protein